MDSKERNRIQLKKGLQQLPQYKAPDHWEDIQLQLDQDKKDVPLKKAIVELPAYAAPDFIWSTIETQLEAASGAKVRRLSIMRWAAAAVLVGLCTILILKPGDTGEIPFAETIKYEQINLSPVEWKGDDPTALTHVKAVVAAVSQQSHTWNEPGTQALKGSLDQVTQAIAHVEQAGEMGGLNDQMKNQLTKMFIKRNQLVRQLAAKI